MEEENFCFVIAHGLQAEIDRLRAELAEAYRLRDAHHNDAINSRLETESVRAEQAESEVAGHKVVIESARKALLASEAEREQIELANKEFGDQLAHAHIQLAEAHTELALWRKHSPHAELAKAKAERDAMRGALQKIEQETIDHVAVRIARAALAPSTGEKT